MEQGALKKLTTDNSQLTLRLTTHDSRITNFSFFTFHSSLFTHHSPLTCHPNGFKAYKIDGMSNQPGRSSSFWLFLHARVSLWCLSNRSLQSGCFMKIIRDGFLSCIGSWSFRSITCSCFSTDLSLASSSFSGLLKSDSFRGSLGRNHLDRKWMPNL